MWVPGFESVLGILKIDKKQKKIFFFYFLFFFLNTKLTKSKIYVLEWVPQNSNSYIESMIKTMIHEKIDNSWK